MACTAYHLGENFFRYCYLVELVVALKKGNGKEG